MATAITRLNLVKRLARWSGTVLPSEVTSTTTPDTDHIADLVAFVDQAWIDIQTSQNRWAWMRHRLDDDSVPLVALTRTLTMAAIAATARAVVPFLSRGGDPLRYVMLKHPTSLAIHKVAYVPLEDFRGYRDRGTRPTQKPTRYTVRANGDLEFDPTPDVAYTINCDWTHIPSELIADGTTPDMPAHFHQLIVWWAIVYLMDFDENGGRYQTADRQLKKMLNRLSIEQLPDASHDGFMSLSDYGL